MGQAGDEFFFLGYQCFCLTPSTLCFAMLNRLLRHVITVLAVIAVVPMPITLALRFLHHGVFLPRSFFIVFFLYRLRGGREKHENLYSVISLSWQGFTRTIVTEIRLYQTRNLGPFLRLLFICFILAIRSRLQQTQVVCPLT